MNPNSKAPARGSRGNSLLPNSLHHLRLLEIRIVGADKSDEVTSLEIIGWDVGDGRSIPITIFGPWVPKPGYHYAITSKGEGSLSHTDLSDGKQYRSYADMMTPKWEAHERAPVVEPASVEVEVQPEAGPQPWKPGPQGVLDRAAALRRGRR